MHGTRITLHTYNDSSTFSMSHRISLYTISHVLEKTVENYGKAHTQLVQSGVIAVKPEVIHPVVLVSLCNDV